MSRLIQFESEDSGLPATLEDEYVPPEELPIIDDSIQKEDASFYRQIDNEVLI